MIDAGPHRLDYFSRVRRIILIALVMACAETTAPLPPPEELLAVVNTADATLSLISISNPATPQTRVLLPGPVGEDARPTAGRVHVIVAADGGQSLAVVNLRDRVLERVIELGQGAGARGAALIGDSVAWVALSSRDAVIRVELASGDTTSIAVGRFPKDVVVARGRLFVINANLDPCPAPEFFCPAGESWVTVLDPVTRARAGGLDSIPLPGPGNASYAAVGADGRIYVLSVGGGETPAGRLSIVDPVARQEVGSFGGFGERPGPIATDRGERVIVSSPVEGLMEFNTRSRAVVRGEGDGIPLAEAVGVATDSRNGIYGVEAGSCAAGVPGRVRVFRPDFTEVRSIPVGVCPGAATTALIPPDVDAPTAR